MTKKKKKKSRQAKVVGEGLEGFVDWTNPTTQEGTTPSLEIQGDKPSRSSRFDDEVQADPGVIAIDPPE